MAARPELPTTAPPGENDPLFRSRQSEQENARVENGETASGGRPPVGATKPPRPKFGVLPNSAGSQPVSTATAAAGATSPGVTKQTRKRPEDYIFGKILGEGSFATVFLARDVQTHKEYAIKVCDKQQIVREKKAAYVRTEKEVLMRLSQGTCPFFVRLYATFQDSARLCVRRSDFVLSYAKNGELLDYIRKVDSFDEEVTQFYTAELVMGLEYLHSKNIIHRDLKPENILLDENMHIKITDFGSAKILSGDDSQGAPPAALGVTDARRASFVGTAQYVSPEVLVGRVVTKSADLWALGAIIYQFLSGLPPFRAPNEYLTFQKIEKLEYDFPDGFNEVAKDLVLNLLVLDPTQRLGADECGGYQDLKTHPFFSGVRWNTIGEQTAPPIHPYLPASGDNPEVKSEFDVQREAGWNEDDIARMHLTGLSLTMTAATATPATGGGSPPPPPRPSSSSAAAAAAASSRAAAAAAAATPHILNVPASAEERKRRLEEQRKYNPWHRFVESNLIMKQGLVDKRKGLFARRRMMLMTEGPHLYYVDPGTLVLKGEIPFSPELRPEPKNFKIFFVHTPNRTYYLVDPEGYALEWCAAIEEMHKIAYESDDS